MRLRTIAVRSASNLLVYRAIVRQDVLVEQEQDREIRECSGISAAQSHDP